MIRIFTQWIKGNLSSNVTVRVRTATGEITSACRHHSNPTVHIRPSQTYDEGNSDNIHVIALFWPIRVGFMIFFKQKLFVSTILGQIYTIVTNRYVFDSSFIQYIRFYFILFYWDFFRRSYFHYLFLLADLTKVCLA